MSLKSVINSLKLFDAVDGSVAQSSANNPVKAEQLDYARIHIEHDAALDGTFEVYARNGSKDTYAPLDFGAPLITSPDGQVFIRIESIDFTEFYLTYTPTSGTGTITAVLTAKSAGV